MIQLPEDRRPPLTPQLALRAAIVGTFALAMFAIIFFRLWFLQVLSGNQYLNQAYVNRVRTIAILAQRGKILDRTGVVLANSRQALAVQISTPDLPTSPPELRSLYRRLEKVLGMPTKRTSCDVPGPASAGGGTHQLQPIACDVAKQLAILPYANVTIKTDVPRDVQFYLSERQNEFPAVVVRQVYVRNYPFDDLAAQVLGTVGPINGTEITEKAYRGISPSSIIGQSGLEAAYNRYLLGTDGSQNVQVNSLGQPTATLHETPPVEGSNLVTSLDTRLEQVGTNALQQSISSNYPSNGGAFVALNPTDGSVYAMGSLPSYNANIFTTPNLSQATYSRLIGAGANFPLLNRVIDSQGPTGSTFKPITATAALESGAWGVGSIYNDTGSFCTSPGVCRHNAGGAVDGPLDIVNALRVSSDDFFYHLGGLTNVANPTTHPNGGALQHWAHELGIGQRTGVDLPGEDAGTLPSPGWRAHRDALEIECERATGPFKYTDGHTTGPVKLKGWYRSPRHATCGIADGRPWSIGDNINLAVGQGDVQVTPLQLAVAYSTLANDGKVVRPHIGLSVQSQTGTVLQTIDPPPARYIHIDPLYRDTILQGLHDAAQATGGTSDDVFGNFPETVYGKTGTAQYNNQQDYSWYACFVPPSATSKPIVVVVWVEQGGFGAVAAAPVAREILSQWFFGKPGPYTAGSSRTL